MKYSLLLVLTSLVITGSVSAQKRKCQNRFDTTLAKKHELSVSMGAAITSGALPEIRQGKGVTFAIEYARVYRANHFLRTGLRYTANSGRRLYESKHPATPDLNDPGMPGQYPASNETGVKENLKSTANNRYAAAFVGYEYGVGRKWLRFTFGADLLVGYNYRELYKKQDMYQEIRTYDPSTNFFSYDIQFLQTGQVRGTSQNIFVALSPRLGLRADLSKRVALAIAFTPQFGFTQRLQYHESVEGTRPSPFNSPKSTWFGSRNIDFRLIFKLGKT